MKSTIGYTNDMMSIVKKVDERSGRQSHLLDQVDLQCGHSGASTAARNTRGQVIQGSTTSRPFCY